MTCLSMGCNGGQISTPWLWLRTSGAVTGGMFGDTDFCYPYTMPECSHHVTPTPERPDCPEVTRLEPLCWSSCTASTRNYSSDKKYAGSNYSLNGPDAIKDDIRRYGPVSASFTVYDDFLAYTDGIYTHTGGS